MRLLLVLLLLSSLSAYSQVGDSFPALTGETLEGVSVTLPDDIAGKYTFIGMAYSKKAEQQLKGWFQPVYDRFVQDKESAGLFAAFAYDVNVYFIPMFTGAKRVASPKAKELAKEGLDARLHSLVLFYVGGMEKYKKALEFEGRNKPYFFLLDESGKIIYATSGKFTEKKLEEIENLLAES